MGGMLRRYSCGQKPIVADPKTSSEWFRLDVGAVLVRNVPQNVLLLSCSAFYEVPKSDGPGKEKQNSNNDSSEDSHDWIVDRIYKNASGKIAVESATDSGLAECCFQ
jgi:hypothetical protein